MAQMQQPTGQRGGHRGVSSPRFHTDLLLDPRDFPRLISPSVKKGSVLTRSSASTRLHQSCRGGSEKPGPCSQEMNSPRTPAHPHPVPISLAPVKEATGAALRRNQVTASMHLWHSQQPLPPELKSVGQQMSCYRSKGIKQGLGSPLHG